MKRLLALLLLAVAPAFGQGLPPTYDPTVEQTYTVTQPQTPLQNINQNSIGIPLTLYDDGTTFTPIDLQFDFYFFGSLFDSVYISQNGFISFTSNANGCCSGNELPFLSEQSYYNLNNSIFAMWSDLADFNNPGNPYYKSTGNSFTVGWYNVDELGSPNKFNFEISLFADSSFSINYGSFDYTMATGRTFTSGYQGDTATEFNQFYWGNDPSSLQNTTYFVQSSEIVPLQPDQPIAPDCNINPNDPTCIINDLIDFTDEEPIYVADESTGADDGSSDGTEVVEEDEESIVEEMLADAGLIEEDIFDEEEMSEEESLEELLADEDEEEIAAEERILVYRELSDEEKSKVLEDAISKSTLEAALSIASDAVSTATAAVAGESTSTSSSSTSSRNSTETSESIVADTSANQDSNQETAVASNEGDASAELLETGRLLGQEALAATLAGTEASANESMAEAEIITAMSAEASMIAENTDNSSVATQTEEITTSEEAQAQDMGIVAADNVEQSIIENVVAEAAIQAESSTEISFDSGKEMMAENAEQMAYAESQETEALAIVAAAAASSEQTFEDDSAKDAEVTNAMVDPAFAMANTFNQAPNMMSLEFLGVLKPIEKSDAEIRAEQVVAANKEQQDAINANYMDADQSGIVSAIAVDADVSSYLTQRIPDVPFYMPEDIYKGIIIKDNVRGSYFLEKGNTDTYKKMVDEQYK